MQLVCASMLLALRTQSPSEDILPLFLLGGSIEPLLAGRQFVALWEGVQNSLCLFIATPCDGPFSSVLGGVSNCLLRAWNRALLAVGHDSLSLWEGSSELLLVTPLAFSDLALGLLGTLLILGGCSGVEVFLI